MKLFTNKSLQFFLLIVIHFVLALCYSYAMPWDGDEWSTYRGVTIMALPYQFFMYLVKIIFGAVTASNFIIYRQIGSIFLALTFAFLYSVKNNKVLSSFILISMIYLALNPYVFFQEQFFRYYSLYFLFAFIVFYWQLEYLSLYKNKRLLFYSILLVSPFLHFFLTWQLAFYIAFQEIRGLNKQHKKILFVFSTLIFCGLLLFWKSLMKFILPLAFQKMQATGNELRGISMNAILKPIVYFFQYFFGYHVSPNENGFVILILTLLVLFTVISVFKVYKFNRENFWFIVFCGIIPYLAMFIILEPLTLPGSTQFESKHALFIIPFLLYSFTFLNYSKNYIKYTFYLTFGASIIIALFYSFQNNYPNWAKIKDMAKSCENIITDGPANESAVLYLNKDLYHTYWNDEYENKICSESKNICLIYSDFKSYQILTKEQMWGSGTGSDERNRRANALLQKLKDNGFKAVDSYSLYPLMCYIFHKTNIIQPIPWFYTYAYSDLNLPVKIDKKSILGWFPYQKGDTIQLNHPFYYMIENKNSETKSVAKIIRNNENAYVLTSISEVDIFRSHFCVALDGYAEKVMEWHKRPLLSNSLAYPGSFMPGTGYIYKFVPKSGDKALLITEQNVKLWYGVVK